MPAWSTFAAFSVAAAAVLAVPGPSAVYVLTRSVQQGRAAGLYSMLGLETGALLHVAAAAAGLATVLASSDAALTAVRWGGAGYLLHLGVRQLVGAGRGESTDAAGSTRGGGAGAARAVASRSRIYRDGVLVDLLNPKTALFLLAFLPQFVEPDRGPVPTQVLALGLAFVAMAVVCDSSYALAGSSLRERLGGGRGVQVRLDRSTGVVYLALGAAALWL